MTHDLAEVAELIGRLEHDPVDDDSARVELVGCGAAAVAPLVDALGSGSVHLRVSAALTLGDFDHAPTALAALHALLGDHAHDARSQLTPCAAAALALMELGDASSVAPLTAVLRRAPGPEEREYAAFALEKIADPSMREDLRAALALEADENVRRAIELALDVVRPSWLERRRARRER